MINLKKLKHIICSKHPQERMMYAITDGIHKGTCIIFFELDNATNSNTYDTLAFCEDLESIGGMKVFNIPKDAVTEGFEKKIIEPIKRIPRVLNKSLHKEFLHRKELLNQMPCADEAFEKKRSESIRKIVEKSINNHEDYK